MSLTSKQTPSSSTKSPLSVTEIDDLSNQLLELDLELNSNIPTTLWISDLHGEGDRFKSISYVGVLECYIKRVERLYLIRLVLKKIQYLTKIIRKKIIFHQ